MEFQLIRIRLVNIMIKVYLNSNIMYYHFRCFLLVFLFEGYLVVNEKMRIDIDFCLVVCFQP
jgi:hypothetical protein